jgi:hypothetical protein
MAIVHLILLYNMVSSGQFWIFFNPGKKLSEITTKVLIPATRSFVASLLQDGSFAIAYSDDAFIANTGSLLLIIT